MIIYGVKTTESTESTGTFSCPRCRTSQACRRLVLKRWFTLYFIPVIPLGRAGQQVECQGCYSRYSPDALTPDGVGEPYVAQLCGEPGTAGLNPPSGTPATSPLSITSLIFGLLSPLLLCACGLSLVSSLVAVVTGHLALTQIGRSAGRLAGRGIAFAGLILGYVFFAITLVAGIVLGPAIYGGWKAAEQETAWEDLAWTPPSAEDRLLAAEAHVLKGNREGILNGNTPEAHRLAHEYTQALQRMRDLDSRVHSRDGFPLVDRPFTVYCARHPGRCALIVHVPAYYDFSEAGEQLLETDAWRTAQSTVKDVCEPGDYLAVGLRGADYYGAILVGRAGRDGATGSGFTRADRQTLVAFFSEEEDALGFLPSPASEDFSARSGVAGKVGGDEPVETRPPPAPRIVPNAPATQVPPVGTVVQQFSEMGWPVKSLAFSPDGRHLAAGSLDGTLLLLDVETGQKKQSVSVGEELSEVTCLAFSGDGRKLFAGDYEGMIHVWDVDESGNLDRAGALQGHTRPVTCLQASQAAPFVISGSAKGDLMWQAYNQPASSPRELDCFERSVLAVHLPKTSIQALATDGRHLIEFDLKTAQIVGERELHRSSARVAAFSAEADRLAVSSGSKILVFDTRSGTELQTLSAVGDMQYSLMFLPDGDRLVSGGRGLANCWKLTEDKPLGRIDLGGVLYIQSLTVSKDGSLLAAIPSAAGQTLTVVRMPEP